MRMRERGGGGLEVVHNTLHCLSVEVDDVY